ncbi:MAG TPA: hypothetical protein VMJ34_13690 [Bryobacteraceae bacterium]|nr:hypothetical protein [Bryobacteraceae bacterium]
MGTAVRIAFIFAASAAAFGQYKTEPAGAPPSDVAPAIRDALQKDGVRVTGPKGTVCEIWLRTTAPSGPKSTESDLTLPTVPHGSLLGVIRYPEKGSDRRGTAIQPGVYTLRYSYYPVNGDHQGVAPQRDFALLSSAAADADLNATPTFDQLVAMSKKASGATHPLVLSIWNPDPDYAAGLDKQGETDWVLQEKLGNQSFAIILVGTAGS